MPKNGQKPAKQRRLTTAQRLKGTPLYDALNEIARLHFPLDSGNIARREAITTCRAVVTYTGGDANIEERAIYAATAIKHAVAQIRTQPERPIAEAAFGLGDFEGNEVKDRVKRIREAPYNISENVYWKHRPDAIEQVIHRLNQPSADVEEPQRWVQQRSNRKPMHGDVPLEVLLPTRMAEAADTLHFAALAALFVAEYEEQYALAWDAMVNYEMLAASENLFFDFVTFLRGPNKMHRTLYGHPWEEEEQTRDTTYPFRPGYTEASLRPADAVVQDILNHESLKQNLPEESRKQIHNLYSTLMNNVAPFDEEQYKHIAETVLGWPSLDRMGLFAGIPQSYLTTWRMWFAIEVGKAIFDSREGERQVSLLEVMAAKSGRIAQIIRRHIDLAGAIEAEARWLNLTTEAQ